MSFRRIALLPTLWMVAAVSACDACKGHATSPEPVAVSDAGTAVRPEPRHSPVFDERLFLLAGEKDIDNLYLSTVIVIARLDGKERRQCSGVALSRRVVLTAGHCVCALRKPASPGGETLIDASQCTHTAIAKTVVYSRVQGLEDDASSQTRVYRGKVLPHPALRVVLSEQGVVTSSKADLAVLVLDKPLDEGIRTEAPADTEVHAGESIVIVGHSYDEVEDVFDEERRFSQNKVVELTPGGDRVLIAQPGKHPYRGDSGGPCFRQGVAGPILVGVSSRWLGKGAAFTSVHDYRDWIQGTLRLADEVGDAGRPPHP
jgi:hypothetical protein